ncbi:MAG: YaiI/YqxD family protein [Idiomarina sp.]
MEIYIDADACPVTVREILFRAAERKQLPLWLVANQRIKIPPSRFIKMIQVGAGFDVADHEIVRRCNAGDLVITSDIPLAAEVIEKHGQALSPRGELFTPENIRQRLNIRDFMDTMRSSGVQSGGPPPLSNTDRKNFADHLDRILARA